MKQFIISLLFLPLTIPVSAAPKCFQTPEDEVVFVKSQQGFVFLYNQGKLHFTMEFIGRELVHADSERIFFKIDGRMVQLQTAKVAEFLPTSDKPKLKDTEILEKHREWEQNHLGDLLKAKLNVTLERVTTKGKREGLLWHFPMPEGMNQQVSQQVFLTSVIGDQVLILNSSVEKEGTVINAANYLTDALSSLKVSDKSIDLKALQEELRKR